MYFASSPLFRNELLKLVICVWKTETNFLFTTNIGLIFDITRFLQYFIIPLSPSVTISHCSSDWRSWLLFSFNETKTTDVTSTSFTTKITRTVILITNVNQKQPPHHSSFFSILFGVLPLKVLFQNQKDDKTCKRTQNTLFHKDNKFLLSPISSGYEY